MNIVILNGRNCQDLELVETGKGKNTSQYVRFNLAVNDGRDKDGNKLTQFIPCIAWGTLASTMAEYVKKGDRLAVEGRLNIQKYTDEDDKTRTSVQVVLSKVDFIETRKDADDDEDEAPKYSKRKR